MARQLQPEEREVISQMLAANASREEIARTLGRDPSTIYREVHRNGMKNLYCAVHAQKRAQQRRREARAKSRKLCREESLQYVQDRLRLYWSPDQIAGRSCLEFPDDSRRNFSAQTIYTWLANDDHRRRWIIYLRDYKPRKRRKKAKTRTGNALDKRPEVVNNRERFGDWEGDTIVGSGRAGGALVSLNERRSGYLALLPVPNRKSKRVRRTICGRLQKLPAELRKTMTFDNGSEFAEHRYLNQGPGMDVFLTDPHSPWQRGSNEHLNRLVRQFFPKGTDFRKVSRHKVAQVEQLLNDRPRKRLNYRTPSEVLNINSYRAIQT